MASQDISIRLKMAATGVDQQVENSERIADNYAKANSSAQKLASAPKTRAAAMAGSRTSSEMMEYTTAGGVTGRGGASARDFANQAQGLGGLVRLYATYAANIFAVTTAFNALKDAADTANLIKGLDQLGARSGIALGNLSKQFAEATDNIVSLREAAQVTAKASAAGLSNKQILEIAKGAKVASQALGIDALDAVNRLTRGITKLEPELLDELGIYTKIEPAVEKYARSLGVASNSLTDFQRRQAFALATLEEVDQKFGSLELEANPYSKLLAQTKDVAFQILDTLNIALIPLVNILSSSPTALLGVISALSVLLLRQALPAVGEFRAGLERTAREGRDAAVAKAEEAAKAQKLASNAIIAEADRVAEARVAAVVRAEKKIIDTTKDSVSKRSNMYKLLNADIDKLTDEQFNAATKAAEADAKRLQKKGRFDDAANYRAGIDALKGLREAHKEFAVVKEQEIARLEQSAKWYSIEGIRQTLATKAAVEAKNAEIISNAAYNASLIGVEKSMKIVNNAMEEAGITGMRKVSLSFKSFIASIGGAATAIGAAINSMLGYIGLLVTAVTLLDTVFSKSGKQLDEFNDRLKEAEKSTANLERTFEAINKAGAFSIESLVARNNALKEQSKTFDDIAAAAGKATNALKTDKWDNFWDSAKSLIFRGTTRGMVQTSFEKSITEQIMAVIENVDDPKLQEALQTKVQEILNISAINAENLGEALKDIKPGSEILKQLSGVLQLASNRTGEAAMKANDFKESFTKAKTAYQELVQQFQTKDPLTKFALEATNSLLDLDKAMSGDIRDSVGAMQVALNALASTPIFGIDAGTQIAGFQREMSDAFKTVNDANKELESLKQKLKELGPEKTEKLIATRGGVVTVQVDPKELAQYRQQRNDLLSQIATQEVKQNAAFARAERIKQEMVPAIAQGLSQATGYVAQTINAQLAKGSTTILQGLYSAFDTVPEYATKMYELKVQELQSQQQLLISQRSLVSSQFLLTAAIDKANALQNFDRVRSGRGVTPDSPEYKAAEDEITRTSKTFDILSLATTNQRAALAQLRKELGDQNPLYIKLAQQVQNVALATAGYSAQINQTGREIDHLNKVEKPIDEYNREINRQNKRIDGSRRENELLRERGELLIVSLNPAERVKATIDQQRISDLIIQQEETTALNNALKIYNELIIKANALKDPQKGRDAANEVLSTEKKIIAEQTALKLEQGRQKIIRDQLESELYLINEKFDINDRLRELEDAEITKNIEINSAQQRANQANLKYTEDYLAKLDYIETVKRAQAQRDKDVAAAQAKFEREEAINTAKLISVLRADTGDGEGGLSPQTTQQLNTIAAASKQNLATKTQSIALADIQLQKETAIADKVKEGALQTANFNEQLRLTAGVVEGLAGAFGTVGEKIGGVITVLAKYQQDQEKGANTLKALIKERDELDTRSAKGQERYLELNQAITKQINANVDAQVSGDLEVLRTTKNVFKEKTFAHKALLTLEKANAIVRLALNAREIAANIAGTLSFVTQSVTRGAAAGAEASILGVKAVISAISSMPFPLNLAAGAATTAVVGALLATIGKSFNGKGNTVSTVGLTAEDMNKVTGTGQEYRNGQLVTREGGVVGDPTALADSVTSSIDTLSKNVFDIFNSDSSKIIKNLRDVERNTKQTVKALIEPAGSLVSGQSPFGTIEGSTKTQDPWWRWGPLKSTTRNISILSSGIQVQGRLDDLINQTGNTILRSFENIQIQVKKKFLGVTYSDKSYTSTIYGALDPDVIAAFVGSLTSFKLTMLSAAETLEGSADRITPIIENFNFELTANLKGLSAQERSAKILAEISRNLNNATLAAYPWITAFTDLNEEYFEALSRVAIEGEQLTYGLGLLGLKINETDLYARTLAQQDLIAGAGGLEEFADGLMFIVDNFLTESDRLGIAREKVNKGLTSLAQQYNNGNIAVIKTREEYLRLIKSLDLTNESSRGLFNSLLELAPTFEEVAKASDEVINIFKDIQAQIFDLEFAMTPLEKALNGINRQQQEYVDKLKAADQAIYENIETVVKWAKLSSIQEIDKEIQKLYETRRNEINGTIESLKAAKTRILDLKNALLQGVQSILTPQEKYIKLLDEYNATLEKAKTGDKAALERFPQLSQSLLDSGREMYSSSQVYTDLFNTVSSDLTNLDLSLSQQLSDAEQQLQQLESQTSFLQKIDSSTNATATKLAELIALRGTYSSMNIRDIALQLTPLSSPTTTPIPSAVSTATYTGNPSNTNNAPSITGGFSNLRSNILSFFGIQYGTKSTQIDTTEIVTAITTGNQQVVEAVESLEVTTAKSNVANANTITNAITTNSSNTVYESRVDGFVQYYVTG